MGKIKKYLSAELKEGESVLHVIRESSLVVWPRMLLGAGYNVILFFFMFPLFALGTAGIGIFIFLFALGVWYVGKKFFHWYRNALVVTTERIIDVEQKGWLNKQISEVPHYKIDNVSHRIRGIFHNIFRCGDLFIQSRGGVTSLMMKNVSRPAKAQSFLQQILEQVEERW